MKEEISRAAAAGAGAAASACAGEEAGGDDGATGSSAAFGSSEAAARFAEAQPIMAIKKKPKKRDADDAKLPAKADEEDGSNKKRTCNHPATSE